MQPVKGVPRSIHRRIKSECNIGNREVFVNSLGNTDYWRPHLVKLVGNGERTIAAYHDQSVKRKPFDIFKDNRGEVFLYPVCIHKIKGVPSVGSTKDGPSKCQYPLYILLVEWPDLAIHETFTAVLYTYYLPLIEV